MKLINAYTVIAMLLIFTSAYGDDLSSETSGTDCDCLSKRMHELDAKYGAASIQSYVFMDHVIYTCRPKSNKEYNACGGEL